MAGGQGVRRAALFMASPRGPRAVHRRHIALAIAGALFLIALNVAMYLAPIDYAGFTTWAYAGAFVVTFLANALVAIPIPYIPIVVHIGQTAGSAALVVALAAFGSVLGESVAYLVGRAEQGLISEHAIYKRVHSIAKRPFLAGLVLFALSAPLNPVFDIAGLAAGAAGMPYRIFFIAVFAGRLVRFAVMVWLGRLLFPGLVP
jgi:membrane protein YqaA with SNARE-associated domain